MNMENKICSDSLKRGKLEFKIDKYDNLKTFFNKVINAARSCIIDNKSKSINYNISKDIRDKDLKKLCEIASNFPSKGPFMKLVDDLLFYVLYRREKLLLKKPRETKRIKELSDILHEFSDYKNIIADETVKERLKPRELDSHLYDGVNRLVILVTHSCQLRCRYCSVRKFPARIERKDLFRAIDLLFTSSKKDLQLQFFGGEPLLEFDLIKEGVDYAKRTMKKHNKNIKFILTTNGISLTKDKIDYLNKQNFLLEFSIDGTIETQLKTRVSTDGRDYYSVVLNNLKNAVKSGLDFYTISVVTPKTVDSLFKNFRYLFSMGQRRIQINYSLGVFWNAEKIKKLLSEIGGVMNFVKASNEDLEFINLGRTRKEPVVLNAEVTVDCDGTVYLETGICLEEDFNEMKSKFSLGTLETVKDINRVASTRFNNFRLLSEIYGRHTANFRRIIINNIELGNLVNQYIKSYRNRRKNEK